MKSFASLLVGILFLSFSFACVPSQSTCDHDTDCPKGYYCESLSRHCKPVVDSGTTIVDSGTTDSPQLDTQTTDTTVDSRLADRHIGSDLVSPDGSRADSSGPDSPLSDGPLSDSPGPDSSRPDGSGPDSPQPDAGHAEAWSTDMGYPDTLSTQTDTLSDASSTLPDASSTLPDTLSTLPDTSGSHDSGLVDTLSTLPDTQLPDARSPDTSEKHDAGKNDAGVLCYGLDFDGINDMTRFAHNSALTGMNNITVEAWINPNPSYTLQYLVAKQNVAAKRGYALLLNGGRPEFRIFDGTTMYSVTEAVADQLLLTDQWYHIAGTYDQQTLRIFVNGILVGSETIGPVVIAHAEQYSYLGAHASAQGLFSGTMANAKVFSGTRYNQNFDPTASSMSLANAAAIWPLNEGEGQQLFDRTTHNVDGWRGTNVQVEVADPTWVETPCSGRQRICDEEKYCSNNDNWWCCPMEANCGVSPTMDCLYVEVVDGGVSLSRDHN